ncbi:MAG TPA: DUF1344 domain-containing protein [Candidatus Methylomirabilis sp.]|nr:DUF1344 domain-containing protein [Candidatus Methylomirabilis sp.]
MRQAFTILVTLSMVGTYAWAQTMPTAPNPVGSPAQAAPSDSVAPQAKEVHGKVRSLDRSRKTVTLEDGTKLTIPESIKITSGSLKRGAMVIATYEEKDGQKVVTSILVQSSSKS